LSGGELCPDRILSGQEVNMARLSVVQCDRCFIRSETGPHNLPDGWCVVAVSGVDLKGPFEAPTLLLCVDCRKALEQFMGEIEKAAKPEEPGSKVE
jgi:hypothetical protein